MDNAYNAFTFQSGSIQMFVPITVEAVFVLFTFQSGSIQIITVLPCICVYEVFTFQSGSIQMSTTDTTMIYFLLALHSNLVLFKFAP